MGYIFLLMVFPWLGVIFLTFALPLFFRFLNRILFKWLLRKRFVATERRVSTQEVIVVNCIISNAETSEGSIGESANLPISLVHEQVREAIGEAVVEHAPCPMAHVSLFHAAHDVSDCLCVFASPAVPPVQLLLLCRFQFLPAQDDILKAVGYVNVLKNKPVKSVSVFT